MAFSPHTVLMSMQDISPDDRIGGKAENLLRLSGAGYVVPTWFVIPGGVFDAVLDENRAVIGPLLARAAACHPDDLPEISAAVSAVFVQDKLSAELRKALLLSIARRLDAGVMYAVRSSVRGEDGCGHSFAGLMDSRLHVHTMDIPEAVSAVWASAFSPRALLYRRKRDMPLHDISAAVVVQEMVGSAAAGVLFTRHPETRMEESIISAGFGLGEGIVSNLAEADTYVVGANGTIVDRTMAAKVHMVVRAGNGSSGTRIGTVPPEMADRPVLTDTQISMLTTLGRDIERHFGAPQDIEWAIGEDGTCHVLQTRPIVYRSEPAKRTDIHVWDNANIVESYPGVTLPLTFSFALDAYRRSFRRAAEGFFPFRSIPSTAHPIFENMIGLMQGRVYYNLLNWYEMMSYLPGFRRHKASWDQMIGIAERVDFPTTHIPWYLRISSALLTALRLLSVGWNARKFEKAFRAFYDRASDIRPSDMSPREIVRTYTSIGTELDRFWYRTLHNDFAAMTYYGWLKEMCAAWGPEGHTNLHNDLLCGERHIESVQPVRSLVAMSEMITADPHLAGIFADPDDGRVLERMTHDPGCAELQRAFAKHTQEYGDRGIEELKLERSTFRDDPRIIVRLLRTYAGQGKTRRSMDVNERDVRLRAEEAMRKSVSHPVRRLALGHVLHRARLSVANRENMRFARARLFGTIRKLFRALGSHLCSEGVLASPEDVFYLTTDEVFGAVRGTSTTADLKGLVAERRSDYARYAACDLPERFITRGIPSMHLPSVARHVEGETRTLRGTGCSTGIVHGEAVVVTDPARAEGTSGKILVARSTDPGWVFIMLSSKGIVVEKGSVLSHTAIIGRELGIPTIVGVRDATRLIPAGAFVRMDGGKGEISWE